VTPEQFASWAAHQTSPAVFGAVTPPAPAAPAAPATPGTPPGTPPGAPAGAAAAGSGTTTVQSAGTVALAAQDTVPIQPKPFPTGDDAVSKPTQGTMAQTAAAEAAATPVGGFVFPREQLPDYFVPSALLPANVSFPQGLQGDATRGQKIYSSSACIACHAIAGNPMSVGRVGPNLTHIGTRYTIAGAQYPNTPEYMARWIKNSRAMKPGSLMPTLGAGEVDPITKQKVTAGGLTDQQIADIVAYLQALK